MDAVRIISSKIIMITFENAGRRASAFAQRFCPPHSQTGTIQCCQRVENFFAHVVALLSRCAPSLTSGESRRMPEIVIEASPTLNFVRLLAD
jgi:hypothetical protein